MRGRSVSPAEHAILYLTSGATGEPKMVLVTHSAIVSNFVWDPPCCRFVPDDIHGRLPALGPHRAARGDRAAADPRRHAVTFSESL